MGSKIQKSTCGRNYIALLHLCVPQFHDKIEPIIHIFLRTYEKLRILQENIYWTELTNKLHIDRSNWWSTTFSLVRNIAHWSGAPSILWGFQATESTLGMGRQKCDWSECHSCNKTQITFHQCYIRHCPLSEVWGFSICLYSCLQAVIIHVVGTHYVTNETDDDFIKSIGYTLLCQTCLPCVLSTSVGPYCIVLTIFWHSLFPFKNYTTTSSFMIYSSSYFLIDLYHFSLCMLKYSPIYCSLKLPPNSNFWISTYESNCHH